MAVGLNSALCLCKRYTSWPTYLQFTAKPVLTVFGTVAHVLRMATSYNYSNLEDYAQNAQ